MSAFLTSLHFSTLSSLTFIRSFELDLKPNPQIFQHFKEAIVIGEDGKETPFQVDKENYFIGRDVGSLNQCAVIS